MGYHQRWLRKSDLQYAPRFPSERNVEPWRFRQCRSLLAFTSGRDASTRSRHRRLSRATPWAGHRICMASLAILGRILRNAIRSTPDRERRYLRLLFRDEVQTHSANFWRVALEPATLRHRS